MDPIYRIIETDDWHAWTIGHVYQREDGTYSATWNNGHLTAGGVPMKTSVAADTPGELVVLIRQSRPNALLCNVA